MKKLVVLLAVMSLSISAYASNGNGGKIPSGKVKNIIVMISDGSGYNQIDAASMYQYGKTGAQVYEHFPVKMGMSTYSYYGNYNPEAAWTDFNYVNLNPTDSAAAATAMSTGFKTYDAAIGVDMNGNPLKHIIEYAEERGMATGVVTSVEFSHATPAGFVAHNTSRNSYTDIANEMIYESALEVIMGCGAPDYDNNGVSHALNSRYVGGDATYNDLTDDYKVTGADANGDGNSDDWTVIRSRADFQSMASGETPSRVIGLPNVYTTLQ